MSISLSLGHYREKGLPSLGKTSLAFVFYSLELSSLTTWVSKKCHYIYSQIVKPVLASFYFEKLCVANIKNFPHHFCYKAILHFLLCSGAVIFFFFSHETGSLVGRRRWFLYFELIFQTVSCQIHLSIFQEPAFLHFTL